MAPDKVVSAETDGPPVNPWVPLYAGLGALALAFLCARTGSEALVYARVPLLLIGLLAAGAAVVLRPVPLFVGLATVGSLAATLSVREWDSAEMFLRALTGVGAVASLLLAAPQALRRVTVTLLILFHFGGILTAVFCVPPNPWVTTVLWTYVYRPYLEFMYLNNAYHFYSPDPGPACLLWFRVQYEDGKSRWVKLPNREDFNLAVRYQRRLSLTESVNQTMVPLDFAERYQKRLNAYRLTDIPMYPQMEEAVQVRQPNTYSALMLASYVRHVAKHYPHPDDPAKAVAGIKAYRVVHNIITAQYLARGWEPTDERLYHPYYQGEYDADGNLKDFNKDANEHLRYWVIPILRDHPKAPGEPPSPPGAKHSVTDFVKVHAGDSPLVP